MNTCSTRQNVPPTAAERGPGPSVAELDEIREALRGLSFGQVTLTVQDGVLVQIDRTDRRRLRAKS